MKIVHAHPGIGDPMTEEETRNFLANDNNSLLLLIGKRGTKCNSYWLLL
jgi:hypothetical protein